MNQALHYTGKFAAARVATGLSLGHSDPLGIAREAGPRAVDLPLISQH